MRLHSTLGRSAARLALLATLAAPIGTGSRAIASARLSGEDVTGRVHCLVRLRGEAPLRPRLPVDKNIEHCGETLEDTSLLVQNGRIANAVVWLDFEGARPDPGEAAPGEVQLDTRGCSMEPRVQAARAGARLVLENRDPIMHNPHGWSWDGRTVFNVTLLDDSIEIKRTLRSPGVLRIDCDTHAWMHAYVHVFDHPWYGMTGENGETWIPDVPIGKHRVRIWHEVLGERSADIEVRPGEAAELSIELELGAAPTKDRVPNLDVPKRSDEEIHAGDGSGS